MSDEYRLFDKHRINFQREQSLRNPRFFSRFSKIDFHGKRVLDLGCGLGALSFDLIDKGAEQVTGIDIAAEPIKYANYLLENEFSSYKGKVDFIKTDISTIDQTYDVIVSKAALEHFIGLKEQMDLIKDRINPGGVFVSAIGPLYYSPWGDHNRLKHRIPWSHLFIPEKYFFRKLKEKMNLEVSSIVELGLNGLKLEDYKEIMYNTPGLRVIDFRTNVSEKLAMFIFNLFSYLPFMKEYFTYNIHCVLMRE